MTREELQTSIAELASGATWDEGGQWPVVNILPEAWPELARTLKSDPLFAFDYLFCVTGVDWKSHLTVVYHLTSLRFRHTLVVKVKLDRAKPQVGTVCDIWRTAELHEREIRELFGVEFLHHPDPRNLILPDVWDGFPLRKDYEDPVNMIKL
jgi:NADH:ubiquinone oxidoreductase subunit C